MSRPVWHVKITVQLQNSASGVIEIENRDLVTFAEVTATFNRAASMAKQLSATPDAEAPPHDAGLRVYPRAV
jgi:hypothetical protein